MSSEEKILDSSDKGPLPPVGASVATPAGSPAHNDRRPRGRPRKDAGSTPRQRKKSRGRGKAVLEDEDSADGMDTGGTQELSESSEDCRGVQEEECEGVATAYLPGDREEEVHPAPVVSPNPETEEAGTSAACGGAGSSERLCAFCYCGARSLLGQGELKLFKATPGCDPPLRRNHDNSQSGRPRGLESGGTEESGHRSWDELHHVGLPEDADVQSLFDESGQCWAHQRCALWSEGVCQAEDQSLLYVDRAIHSGSTEHCAYCKRLGASIKCCEEGCDRSYHYPCAGGAGTFQDFRKRSVLCTDHIEFAVGKSAEEANCVLCESPGDLMDQLFCTSCGLHYHGMCLDISVTPLKRAGWQCPECKVCQTCKNPGEDTKMLVCDMCDKGYHTFCLQPVMDSIPTNGWRCKNCRVCVQCGTRSSSLLCESCSRQHDSTQLCALCAGSLDAELQKDLLSCHHCKRCFHVECERQVEGHVELQTGMDYVCSMCKHAGFEPVSTQEQETHMDTDTQPAQSDMDCEPAQIDSTEPGRTATEPRSEAMEHKESEVCAETSREKSQQVASEASPKGPTGEKVPATEPPQDTKPAGSPEAPRQEPDPCPESASIQSFTQSIKAKLPHHPESASASGPPETSSLQGEELSSSLEEKKTITPATKDLKSVSETSYEESMEVSFSEVTEPSVENKVSSVPKVEKEKDVGLFEDKMSESLMVEEREKVSEGLTEKDSERSTGALPLKEQETVTVEHQRPSDISLTVKEHAFEGIPADESTKSSKGLLAEQHERTTEECEKSSESLSRKEHEGASDGGKMEVSSEGLTVAECERHVVKEHERGLTVVENCGRSSEEFTVEERKKPSDGLPEVMDFSMDGERSLAKLSSLVEERTSLKPSAVRQPESFHCSVINPQSLSAPGEPSSNVPSATFIPLAPKIGMGKPAISKRKFSPGRPRVKQGGWSASSRLSSPSLSPVWDGPKSRQDYSMGVWSIRVGRGSGFPGRRRPRGAWLTGRGGRGRSRMKNGVGPVPAPGVNAMDLQIHPFREEEENSMHNTVVIFSSTDTFTLKQDMCVVCGSFGQGVEGRLLACAQCGQCYHPYCVNIKITKVVLSKGWRCLECTVCEACGQASDPGRLLLCDECDISYHTYCLNPPLQNVPSGSWKCKWCVSCTQCGATSPGLRCEWQNNYTQCALCASLTSCPVCLLDYSEEEIILQCRQCDRWMHASCQGFHSEEEVEKISDSSFDCSLCQGQGLLSPASTAKPHVDFFLELPVTPQIAAKPRDLGLMRTYTQDGVCLTESGLSQLQSLANSASRRRRTKPKLTLKIINQNSVAVLQTTPDHQGELSRDVDLDDGRETELVDGEGKSDSSPERETAGEDESKGVESCKKRKRKPYRPGIGGFMVRQRNRTGQSKTKPVLSRKDSSGSISETQQGKDDGWADLMPDVPVDEKPSMPDFPENPEVKVRKRYRKKKTKLEEAFPTYLQEAFFGKDLLDKSKQSRQETTGLLEEDKDRKQKNAGVLKLPSNSSFSTSTPHPSKATAPRSCEEPLVDLSEVLKSDTELLGMLSDNMGKQSEESGLDFCPFQVDCSPSPFAGLDVAPLPEEASVSSQLNQGRVSHQDEPLDGILSPELDKMVTDESILSRLYKIPELEGKDVEDLFTAVLSPSTTQAPPQTQGTHTIHGHLGQGPPPSQINSGMFPRMPVINGLMNPNQQFPPSQMPPGANMARNFPPMQRMPFPDNLRDRKFGPMSRDAAGPWSATGPGPSPAPTPAPAAEGETDSLSTAQKSMLKWEKEETLGELATVAPVLYTNVNFPNLKEEYPDWQTRVKQIAKLWRKASSQDRAPYVQKARDNRAALRINKVQMSNETIKRQQQPQASQPLEVFDPAIPPLDPELLFKDPLKHKESEQEQEWKLRQQMRQKSKQQAKIEATQKLEQVKNEQLQQQQQQQQQQHLKTDLDGSGSLQSPGSSQSSNGNMSPMQPTSKNGFSKPQLPGTPTAGSPDDVFLRPHPPPPSSGSQPQSPQMFSPGSSGSRPSSPWDPYAKMVGTPRPPPSGPGAVRRNSESGKSPRSLSEERGKPSSVHESMGSPTALNVDPYAKPPDTPRPAGPTDPFLKPLCPPRVGQPVEGRHIIGSPGHDPFSRGAVRKEAYPRMPHGKMILSDPYARPLLAPIPGSNESGSVQPFKTPMPPPQPQDSNAAMHSRRPSGDPFERPMIPPRPTEAFAQGQQNDPYAHPPLTPHPAMNEGFENQTRVSRQPQPHPFTQPGPVAHQSTGNPYARTPSTSRPDFSHCDPFSQSPYSNPYARMPGTPRPHDPEPYSRQPATSHSVMMNQPSQQTQTQNCMQSPMTLDPYAQPPGTPHAGVPERFARPQNYQRNQDPFNHPPAMARPIGPDTHAQPVGVTQSLLHDPFAQGPRTPHPGGTAQGIRPGPMSTQDAFSPPQVLMQDTFASPAVPGSQTPRHPSLADENSMSQSPSSQPSQTPVHDPFEQAPMNPHPQFAENREQQGLGHSTAAMGQPNSDVQTVPLAEAEERLRQRQRIRELLLRQQQQKSAIRQEKNPQEQPMPMTPGTPQHWNQDARGQQNDIFNRPPPPYPGPGAVRGPHRFHGPYPGDQRGSFPDGQFPRPQFPGDTNNLRQPGPRLGFPSGVQGSGLRPSMNQIQDSVIEGHSQIRRSMSIDLGKSLGGNPMGLQPLPPQGMHMQQHNIMGQPFIELRHRPPESRLRLPFGPPAVQGNRMESPSQLQRPSGFMSGQEMGFSNNQGPKPVDSSMNQTQGVGADIHGTMSMDNLHQSSVPARTGQIPIMRSMSQPASNENFSGTAPSSFSAASSGPSSEVDLPMNEGSEEKIDADESAVKDLEDVEVKDLEDTDLENLNLDADDGKDLDLEANDLHLDDIFLTSGKFDIIAYTDADLDLSEDLDLNDPIDDHSDSADLQKEQVEKKPESPNDGPLPSDSTSAEGKTEEKPEKSLDSIKEENNQVSLKAEKDIKTEVNGGSSQETSCKNQTTDTPVVNQDDFKSSMDALSKPGVHPDATPVLSSLLVNVPPDNKPHKQENCGQQVTLQEPGLQQAVNSTLLDQGAISVEGMNSSLVVGQPMVSAQTEGPLDVHSGSMQDQPSGSVFGVDQKDAVLSVEQPGILPQTQQAMMSQQGPQNRPLLLEEQPLLLQDLLDQERQEQQQQKQMQALIRQRSNDSFFPNIDFDAITDPIMKAKMVALKGINKVMVQNNMGMSQMVMNKFPVGAQAGQGPQGPDGCIPPQQAMAQDGKLAPYMTRPSPPSFGQGFTNEAQKIQYEDWLRETQKLLQMQQKFLEEQIGAHRKSKKALSAKQRTAKKAGREFPEEDAEQLKHVTEQQGVVQKQLEQIRKQQKEHAELIEEYRVKQQQGALQPQMTTGMLPMQSHPGMMPTGPVNQPVMGSAMPMQIHPNQANIPNMPGWRPGAPGPVGPQMPGVMPPQMMQGPAPQQTLARPGQGPVAGESPHVNFDDTNPFSEGFQERERKERLREQQERQRVQLMKEVERQRMKQRMEIEQQQQQGLLSQMPFYNQNLPQDFMQQHRPQQQMQGPRFPQQPGMQPGIGAPSSGPMMGNGPFPQEVRPGFGPDNQVPHGSHFVQGQPRPPRFPGPNMIQQNPGQGHPFGIESTTPLPPNFPGSGPSLIQLYSNIIPDEKVKKKRNRKKKSDEDAESLRAPSTPHSDLTAPLTPCVSDTSSTPTRNPLLFGEQELCETSQPGSSTPGSQSSQHHSELERQLSEGSYCGVSEATAGQQDAQDKILTNIKLERIEASDCHGPKGTDMSMGIGVVKVEGDKEGMSPRAAGQSPAGNSKGEGGNELLKHLLKNKKTPPPPLPRQKSEESMRPEEETSMDNKALLRQSSIDSSGTFSDSQLSFNPDFSSPLMPEDKKKQRTKRAQKSGERPAPRSKKRKKEEDERQAMYSSTEPVMTNLKQQQQLSLLPLMEPLVGVNFAHFVPYGSGQLDGESRLSGTFGSASLDGMSDYYSQLIYKQNNLSNPPTPPASLPPTPPPVARQKLLNGFATTEELAGKAAVVGGHDVTKGLPSRPLHIPFKTEEELFARALAHGPKTVDVPASLPTPPHNNQEELRGQEHCEDRDTPDSFVPSSSPESVVGMEISRYPDLSLVKQEPPSPSLSPVMPMFPKSRGKGSETKLKEIKTEPSSMFFGTPFGTPQNGPGLVSIAITLKPAAAENITDVVAAIANLIRVKIPSSYEVSGGPWLHGSLSTHKALVQGLDPRLAQARGAEQMNSQTGAQHQQIQHLDKSPMRVREQYRDCSSSPGPKPQWCRHCKVVILGGGVRKPKDHQSKAQDSQPGFDGDLVFCSHSCLILHSSSQSKSSGGTKMSLWLQASVALLSDPSVKGSPSKAQHQYNNNMSSLDVHCLAQLQPKTLPPSPSRPGLCVTPALPEPLKMQPKVEPSVPEGQNLKVTVKLKPRSQNQSDEKPWHHGKRWKGLRWRKWTMQIVVPKSSSPAPEKAVEDLLLQLNSSLRPCSSLRDRRRCCFCHQEGDGVTDGAARLLNLDLDTWVHLNCALWSSEVYETQAGALINVEQARQRGRTISCAFCQRLGATSGCHRLRCLNVYHFTCALQAGCTFFKDKTMLCHQHRPRISGSGALLHLEDQQLRCFSVFRRVYVQRDELRQLASAVQRPELGHTFRIGSLLFHTMGQLPPALMPHFHSSNTIFPPGYEASRLYWSMRHGHRRCRYVCTVEERQGRPEFCIRVLEKGYEDLLLTDTTAKGVWDKVLGSVAERRAETGMLRLFPIYLKGEDLFGLTVSAVARIAESLPGVQACSRYRFRYGRNPMLELPLSINPSGSARSELRSYPQGQRLEILSAWNRMSLAIQNSARPEGGSSHSKHFVHSKSSQYRRLSSEWKSNVYLAHSRIQGLGLFAARDIEKQTMVIEYLGNILRNEVAMRKELHYKAKNRAVFMFRIDGDCVIDATCSGSPARYINHSCSPNCVAEVVTFERGYKIIISSNRRIEKGEELCYDYRLALVDNHSKVACLCGAANCRKWMN
ncbi:histone-lysine N-methyltransferase 2C isoform X2 [Neoarius graeffei]|uniref:histone-lysine N-methyltransferase 2C isoform X2 n=1 Tax=Neoarius graeffei TaxID=443677 RepID=UPI00298CE662|nr:histone-lysine N-methyltransferase 2C isoform X2 [Neoarius graeffei]